MVEDVREFAIIADGEGSSMSLDDLVVRRVQPNEGEGQFGGAVSVQDMTTLNGARWLIEDSTESAVQIVSRRPLGTAHLVAGEVRENPIGACVQSDPQVIQELQEDVHYIRNGTPLQATSLPVPEVVGAGE